MNMRWLNFPFQPNTNIETTLGHQHWINVTLSTLFQRCFVNVETTSINIRRLNFHFQPNFNVETTLVHRRWIDVILSTLFQRCFVNVETTSINVRRLNFHFQPNINVDVFARLALQKWLDAQFLTSFYKLNHKWLFFEGCLKVPKLLPGFGKGTFVTILKLTRCLLFSTIKDWGISKSDLRNGCWLMESLFKFKCYEIAYTELSEKVTFFKKYLPLKKFLRNCSCAEKVFIFRK